MKKPNFIAWSYSRYALHKECPQHFKYKHLDKRPEGQGSSPPMVRGNDIHQLLERYVLERLAGHRPPKLKIPGQAPWDGTQMLAALDRIMKLAPSVESEFAFTRKWERCDWRDWDRCWVRVKVDLGYYPTPSDNVTLDYKSGKMKPAEHAEQLDLYALQRMLVEPGLKKVVTGPWYVDHEPEPRLMSVFLGGYKKHAKRLKDYWERVVAPLQKERKFEATPSPSACKWCPFGKSKGGPCTKEERSEYRR